MRKLTIAFCLVACAAVSRAQKAPTTPPNAPAPPKRADANAVTPSIPGLPGPRLKLVDGRFINGKKEGFEGELTVDLGPDGQMVVRIGWRTMKAFDSTGRRLWTMDLSRGGEISDVTALGWRGSELWVSDRRFSQIALIDKGTVTKSLELPSWVRPAWIDRKTFPVFGAMEVDALLADGSMVVLPNRPHSVVGTVGYDSTMQYVLHVSENGIIDRQIAKFKSRDFEYGAAAATARRDDAFPRSWPLPDAYWPRVRVSPDGMRTVLVTVDTSHAAVADTVVVTTVNDKGQVLYVDKFGFPRIAYTESQIDSIAHLRNPGLSAMDRASRARLLPRHLAALRDVTLGRDYSVWLSLRETNDATPVVGIDPAGHFVGSFYLAKTFRFKAADRDWLWIADYRPTFRDVVRYTTTKPPR